jgi:16S rRNA G966 N2-methylase RsmD
MKSEEKRFEELTKPEVSRFIEENINKSIPDLILKGSPFQHIDIKDIVNQIIGKKKAKKKLPHWYKNEKVVYPPMLNLEQTSSEITALHKSKLVSGQNLLDMTGGFGIDSYYFSKKVNTLIYTELNPELCKIVKHNIKVFKVDNFEITNEDSIDLLQKNSQVYNWIYIDPSRRNENTKVFQLKDSLPNIIDHLKVIEEKSEKLMLKTSPMYDLDMGYKELIGVKEVHIISVKNEVKELLWIIDWRKQNSKIIKIFNYQTKKKYSYISIDKNKIELDGIELSVCCKYLYEFDSGIMKSGINDMIGIRYNLKKLEQHTNLYTSDKRILSIPGKIYKVKTIESINYKKIRKVIKGNQVNLISKNFQLNTDELQKKLKCTIGGKSDYLIFAKTIEGNRVIEATRLMS